MASLKWTSLLVLVFSGTAAAVCNILISRLSDLMYSSLLLLAAIAYTYYTLKYLKNKKKEVYRKHLTLITILLIASVAAVNLMDWVISGSFVVIPSAFGEYSNCWGVSRGNLQDNCYYNLAMKREDTFFCKKIESYDNICGPGRGDCIMKIALKTKNPEICEELEDYINRQYCQAITTKNCSLCPPCPEGDCYRKTHELIESCPQILGCPATDCNCRVYDLI